MRGVVSFGNDLFVWVFLSYQHNMVYSLFCCSIIILRFTTKLFFLLVVFSCEGFHVNLVFFFVFVFHYCTIDFKSFYKNSVVILIENREITEYAKNTNKTYVFQ